MRINQFNSGAIYRSGSGATDFNLIELDDPVSASVLPFFAGWNRSAANTTSAVGIHHPAVSEKRISFELNPTTTTGAYNDAPTPNGNYIRVADWDFGTTEGGSSGSPLFNPAGQIVGQLLGGSAACGNNLPDWYGRLSKSSAGGGSSNNRLSNWLDPIGSGATAIDGINADQLIRVGSKTVDEGDSGTHDVALSVTLTPAADDIVTVRLATAPGTPNPATPGEDYLSVDTFLTFAPGETQKTVNVTILTDTVPEENERIAIILSDPTNAILSTAPASIVIRNDEYPRADHHQRPHDPGGGPEHHALPDHRSRHPDFLFDHPGSGGHDCRFDDRPDHLADTGPGNYSVRINTSNPAGSDSELLQIEVLGNSLANAVDLESGIAVSNTDIPWFLQTQETHDGFDAGQSGDIFQSLTTGFSIEVTGPDAIRFFWKVSSEKSYDFLTVSVEDIATGTIEEVAAISGEVDWTEVIVPVPTGEQRVTWAYTKDATMSVGADAGWVDEITLASSSGEPLIISQTDLSVTLDEPFSATRSCRSTRRRP